jgi:hypothetical protein
MPPLSLTDEEMSLLREVERADPSSAESFDNLTPADVYFTRAETVLLERERIKRRLQHQLRAA